MEGLVGKNDQGVSYKIKWWKEAKWAIVGFEKGSMKGAFLVLNPVSGAVGKISALGADFIAAYDALVAAGEKPYAEFEYLYLTKNDIPFQPRLRRIDTEAALAVG
jgi:hypothetical protein